MKIYCAENLFFADVFLIFIENQGVQAQIKIGPSTMDPKQSDIKRVSQHWLQSCLPKW
jgi:hypothetical protein